MHFVRENGQCSCGQRACDKPGKHPLTRNGHNDATNDVEQINRWWKVNPNANIGVATGTASNLLVLDIDPRNGGDASLVQFEQGLGYIPQTLTARTGGGGQHFYFHISKELGCKPNWLPGIDRKGDGGYVIAPPSISSKGRYSWANELDPIKPPKWLLERLGFDDPLRDKRDESVKRNGSAFTIQDPMTPIWRAQKYANEFPVASEGNRNNEAFRLSGHVFSFGGISDPEAFDIVSSWNRRCDPPLEDKELWSCVQSAKVNGTPREPKGDRQRQEASEKLRGKDKRYKFSFAELCEAYPELDPPVVSGLVRKAETANIISHTKVGKSWLAYNLALSVMTGRPWLDHFQTAAGRVLLIDNELRRSTISNRIPRVADAMGIAPAEYERLLDVWALRGMGKDIYSLASDIEQIKPGDFQLVILDAKYRFLPAGTSENDNAAEARFYNLVDQYAEYTEAVFSPIHHTSKGNQSDKRVTDVGAGAGAQSRAADCHLILREHEDPDTVVLDAAVRSFAPIEPLCLRWEFPLWVPANGSDPAKLRRQPTARDQQQATEDRAATATIIELLQSGPATTSTVRKWLCCGQSRAERLLGLLIRAKEIAVRKTVAKGNECDEYYLAK